MKVVIFVILITMLVILVWKEVPMVEDRCRICGTYGPVCSLCWRCAGCGCRPWCKGDNEENNSK